LGYFPNLFVLLHDLLDSSLESSAESLGFSKEKQTHHGELCPLIFVLHPPTGPLFVDVFGAFSQGYVSLHQPFMPELASTASSSCAFRQPPAELWALIFGHARRHLHDVALVSRLFYSLANPLLYRWISLEKPGRIFRLFATILDRRPRLAEYIVELHLTFKQNRLEGDVFFNSFRRLRRLLELEQMRNLKLLNLDMDLVQMQSEITLPAFHSNTPSWSIDKNEDAQCSGVKEPTFQLEVFATDMFCDEHLARFLASQTRIKRLALGGGFDTDFENFIIAQSKLSNNFLPELAFVDCDAAVAAPLIQGRPVTSVQLPLMESSSTVLSSLQASIAPEGVNQLILLLPRSTSPPSLLERVAEGAPRLMQLSIYFGVGYTFDEVYSSLLSLVQKLSDLIGITPRSLPFSRLTQVT
jgi:hypothetical protein